MSAVAKYRKLPVEIDAVQYALNEAADNPLTFRDLIPEWLAKAITDGGVVPEFGGEDYWYLRVQTLEGPIYAKPDDWIIQGVKGEIYPCKPDIFAATYEAVA